MNKTVKQILTWVTRWNLGQWPSGTKYVKKSTIWEKSEGREQDRWNTKLELEEHKNKLQDLEDEKDMDEARKSLARYN